MFYEDDVRSYAKGKYPKEWKRLIRANTWFRKVEPEVEFFIYLDWDSDPKKRFVRLDMFNGEGQFYTTKDKNFKQLSERVCGLVRKTQRIYYGRDSKSYIKERF